MDSLIKEATALRLQKLNRAVDGTTFWKSLIPSAREQRLTVLTTSTVALATVHLTPTSPVLLLILNTLFIIIAGG